MKSHNGSRTRLTGIGSGSCLKLGKTYSSPSSVVKSRTSSSRTKTNPVAAVVASGGSSSFDSDDEAAPPVPPSGSKASTSGMSKKSQPKRVTKAPKAKNPDQVTNAMILTVLRGIEGQLTKLVTAVNANTTTLANIEQSNPQYIAQKDPGALMGISPEGMKYLHM